MKHFNKLIKDIVDIFNFKTISIYEGEDEKTMSKILSSSNYNIKIIPNLDYFISDMKENLILISLKSEKNDDSLYNSLGSLILNRNENILITNISVNSDYIESRLHKVLMSLGFKLYSKIKNHDYYFFFYTYNISTYKNKPDWLNSDNWANPELWEK